MPRCPICTTALTRVDEDGIRSQTCGGCFGTWIGKIALTRLTRLPLPEALANQPLEELAALVTESNTKRLVRCPECMINMTKDRFHPLIPVNLDRCSKCQGFWLDAGELSLLRRLCAELHKSDDPRIVRLREKIAQTNLEWNQRREEAANMPQATAADVEIGLFTLKTLLNILIR